MILPEGETTIKRKISANLKDKDPVYIIKPGDIFHGVFCGAKWIQTTAHLHVRNDQTTAHL